MEATFVHTIEACRPIKTHDTVKTFKTPTTPSIINGKKIASRQLVLLITTLNDLSFNYAPHLFFSCQ
jgi:hypothetical protein